MNKLFFIFAAVFSLVAAISMLLLSYLFGPKRKNQIKGDNFECGMPQAMPIKRSVNTNFYIIAVLFLIFDIELIIIYPWVWSFDILTNDGFIGGLLFIFMVFIITIYVIKRRAIKWD